MFREYVFVIGLAFVLAAPAAAYCRFPSAAFSRFPTSIQAITTRPIPKAKFATGPPSR